MTFAEFCGRVEANGLFHPEFETAWVVWDFGFRPEYLGIKLDDTFGVFIMGGEL